MSEIVNKITESQKFSYENSGRKTKNNSTNTSLEKIGIEVTKLYPNYFRYIKNKNNTNNINNSELVSISTSVNNLSKPHSNTHSELDNTTNQSNPYRSSTKKYKQETIENFNKKLQKGNRDVDSKTRNGNNNQNKLSSETFSENFPLDESKKRRYNSVGDRLFETSKIFKSKIENKKAETYLRILKNMSPEITKKAKNIKRNPNLFGERLYPYHKIGNKKSMSTTKNNSEQNFNIQENELYGENSLVSIYRKTQVTNFYNFNHQPNLNKKSIKMAEKFEPSITRLTKRKNGRSLQNLLDVSSNEIGLSHLRKNLSEGSIRNSKKLVSCTINNSIEENKKSSERSIDHMKGLYQKGLESMNRKEYLHYEKKKNDQEYYKNFSYTPDISTSRRNINQGENTRNDSRQLSGKKQFSIYEKNTKWQNNIVTKTQSLKHQKDRQLIVECTFTPKIDKQIPESDIVFIKKNLNQINEYIIKRRNVLMKQDEDKKYAYKKLHYGDNFKIKKTIPKEFVFNKSKSRKSLTSLNQPKLLHNVSGMLEIRKQLNIEPFFKDEIHINEVNLEKNKKANNYDDINSMNNHKNNSSMNEVNKTNDISIDYSKPTASNYIVNTEEELKYYLSFSNNSKPQFKTLNEEKKETILTAVDKLNEKFSNLKYI